MRKHRRAVLLFQRIVHGRGRRRLRRGLVRHIRVRLLRRHSVDGADGSADGIAIVVPDHAAQHGTNGAAIIGTDNGALNSAHADSDSGSIGNANDAAICGTYALPDRFAIGLAICRAIIVADCLSFGFSNSVTDNNPDGRAIDYANVTAHCCAHIRSVIISHGAANIDPNTIAIGISDSDTHDDAD